MPLGEAVCTRCEVGFDPSEQIVNSAGELWHPDCFVCAQCFQPFPDGVFYEFEGRKYCEHDFQVLFAPCCQQCNEFIIGRVIKAMNASWHPACFRCNMCSKELADLGFIKNGNQALCHDCNARIRLQGTGRYMCHKCHAVVDGEPLRFRGELYHPYHFNCKACGIELDSRAREVKSRAGYTSCRAERAVLSALPRQDGHPDMWRVPPAHRGASGHRARQELARGAFRVRQVREALPGPPPLREEGSGVLPHRLPPALRKHLLCVQLRRRGRSGALAEQGLVPASLRLQRLRSAAHAQVQVLRDGHETGVQEVLREAAARAAPPPQAAARERGEARRPVERRSSLPPSPPPANAPTAAANKSPGAANTPLGAANTPPGAANTSLGAANTSPGAANTPPGAANATPGAANGSSGAPNAPIGPANTAAGTANVSAGAANTLLETANMPSGTAVLSSRAPNTVGEVLLWLPPCCPSGGC
ncbi:uncharacterized protein LOC119096898 isoform X2 [Pollicipes pollicipes]|nr:uncharacterized protein LOC119096898 isoform X2 [Pollicipes pollicipes]